RQVLHSEDTRVDQDEAGAFVAVPAEVRFGDGELRIGVRPEPPNVRGQRFAGALDHEAGVVFVFGVGQTSYLNVAALSGELAVAGTTQNGEVTGQAGCEVDLPAAIAEVVFRQDRRCTGDVLVRCRRQTHGEQASLVEERLMPADVGRRLPAGVVVKCQHRQPV